MSQALHLRQFQLVNNTGQLNYPEKLPTPSFTIYHAVF